MSRLLLKPSAEILNVQDANSLKELTVSHLIKWNTTQLPFFVDERERHYPSNRLESDSSAVPVSSYVLCFFCVFGFAA